MYAQKSSSLSRKLLAKPAAVFALMTIAIVLIIAVFAYPLAPDNTPYANRMIVEYSVKPPGFSNTVLLVPKKIVEKQSSKLYRWFMGTPSSFHFIPINHYWFEKERLGVQHYIDEGLQDSLYFSYEELLPVTKSTFNNLELRQYLIEHNIWQQYYYLGTDRYGRDILSRLLVGARVSIAVGIVTVLLSLSIGIILGAIAGYYGGKVDQAVMWVINILW
ncbi:MAG TPA: ABC transporter permease, partial [Flavipsychrobacter sp.]|nr:ABC transporter permease [Flavipsychrobacter sp.]